jgi:murein DD-endopeptidase MepM/ murein hydrolase activator NlpD
MDLLELLSSKIAGGTRAPIESFVVEQADLAPPEGEPDLDPTFGPSDGSEPQPTPFMLGQEVGRELTRAQTAQPGVFGHPLSPDIVPSGTGLFGQPRNRGDRIDKHEGIDLSAPHGTPFTAMGAGIVVRAGVSDGYGGNVIEIDHGDGWTSLYYHNAENLVTAGTRVPAGAQIGLVGATGNADSPHIHLEMRHNGVPVDPMTVIGQQPYDNRPTKPLPEGLD